MPQPMHDTYLPFTEQQLLPHFAEVAGGGDAQRHLAYYRSSIQDAKAYQQQLVGTGTSAPEVAASRGLQVEKDERFWVVTALMSVFHGPDPATVLTTLLSSCLGDVPPFEGADSWADALGSDPKLFFEVNLPSPQAYRDHLAAHLDERVLIPHLRQSASAKGARLEGATKVDAMIVSDSGFAVLFEAKVLSDVSTTVRYDVLRNQLARNIDVMLEPNPKLSAPLNGRLPDRTCLVLTTPQVFKTHPSSRLYGWLLPAYRTSGAQLLAEHLPHRDPAELADVPPRLGWLTWEDIEAVHPGACPWLATA